MAATCEVTLLREYTMSMTLCVLLCCCLSLFVRRLKRGIRDCRGFYCCPEPRQYFPGSWSWLNFWELANAKDAISVLRKWSAASGRDSLINLGLGPMSVIVLLSPENIQTIFGSGDANYLEKPKYITDLARPVPWLDGVNMSRDRREMGNKEEADWEQSVLQQVGDLEPMNETSRALVTKLESLFEPGLPQEIQSILHESAYQTICKILLGIESDDEYNRFDCDNFISGMTRYLEIVTDRYKYPWLAPDCLFRFHPSSKELRDIYSESEAFFWHFQR